MWLFYGAYALGTMGAIAAAWNYVKEFKEDETFLFKLTFVLLIAIVWPAAIVEKLVSESSES